MPCPLEEVATINNKRLYNPSSRYECMKQDGDCLYDCLDVVFGLAGSRHYFRGLGLAVPDGWGDTVVLEQIARLAGVSFCIHATGVAVDHLFIGCSRIVVHLVNVENHHWELATARLTRLTNRSVMPTSWIHSNCCKHLSMEEDAKSVSKELVDNDASKDPVKPQQHMHPETPKYEGVTESGKLGETISAKCVPDYNLAFGAHSISAAYTARTKPRVTKDKEGVVHETPSKLLADDPAEGLVVGDLKYDVMAGSLKDDKTVYTPVVPIVNQVPKVNPLTVRPISDADLGPLPPRTWRDYLPWWDTPRSDEITRRRNMAHLTVSDMLVAAARPKVIFGKRDPVAVRMAVTAMHSKMKENSIDPSWLQDAIPGSLTTAFAVNAHEKSAVDWMQSSTDIHGMSDFLMGLGPKTQYVLRRNFRTLVVGVFLLGLVTMVVSTLGRSLELPSFIGTWMSSRSKAASETNTIVLKDATWWKSTIPVMSSWSLVMLLWMIGPDRLVTWFHGQIDKYCGVAQRECESDTLGHLELSWKENTVSSTCSSSLKRCTTEVRHRVLYSIVAAFSLLGLLSIYYPLRRAYMAITMVIVVAASLLRGGITWSELATCKKLWQYTQILLFIWRTIASLIAVWV